MRVGMDDGSGSGFGEGGQWVARMAARSCFEGRWAIAGVSRCVVVVGSCQSSCQSSRASSREADGCGPHT